MTDLKSGLFPGRNFRQKIGFILQTRETIEDKGSTSPLKNARKSISFYALSYAY